MKPLRTSTERFRADVSALLYPFGLAFGLAFFGNGGRCGRDWRSFFFIPPASGDPPLVHFFGHFAACQRGPPTDSSAGLGLALSGTQLTAAAAAGRKGGYRRQQAAGTGGTPFRVRT